MDKLKKIVNSHPALVALGVLVIALLIFYSNSFTADWHYDDYHHIKENINIRKISNLPVFFTDPTTFSRNPNTRMYRPLLLVTLAINYYYSFYDVVGYHWTNFAFHLATCFALFLIIFFLFRERVPIPGLNPFLPAIFGSTLFGLHTINTETIVYMSSRSAGLSTLFVAFAFFCYLRAAGRQKTSWLLIALGAACYGLGLLSKEISITLPALLVYYELLLNREKAEGPLFDPAHLLRIAARIAPFAAVAVAYLVLRKVILSEGSLTAQIFQTGGGAAAPTFGSQMATQLQVWVYYLRETLWPTSLSIDKPFEVSIRFLNPKTILATALLGSMLAWALSVWRKYPLLTFGILWFFTTLLPESVFRLNVVLNDHRLYYPLVGLIVVITFVSFRLYVRFREEAPVFFRPPLAGGEKAVPAAQWALAGLMIAAIAALNPAVKAAAVAANPALDLGLYEFALLWTAFLCAFAACAFFLTYRGNLRFRLFIGLLVAVLLFHGLGTFKRNMAFATEETIWKDTILKDKFAVRGYNNLGIFYEQTGKLDLAIKYYQKTAQLAPLFPNAYINLGNVYHKKKQYDLATRYMKRAIELEPDSSLALYNLGNILREANKEAESIEAYKKALFYNPRYIEAANNLANIYFKNLDYKNAVSYYQAALDIDPTFGMSYYNLALAYEALGNLPVALTHYEDFLRFWDGDPRYKQMAIQKVNSLRKMVNRGK
jgi:protein O-mannosyl-transferase